MFNWDEFRNGKVAVNCDTEEKAREFIEQCHSRNLRWRFSRDNTTNYDKYKAETCYVYNFESKEAIEFSKSLFYKRAGFKIIKWESENMKFKVGDKVTVINGGKSCSTSTKIAYKLIAESDGKAYKWEFGYGYEVGPNYKLFDGLIGEVVGLDGDYALINLIINSDKRSIVFRVDGIEFVEAQTEFTFQEVVARIKPGETYRVTNDDYSIKEIHQELDGRIRIVGGDVMWIRDARFKLQEPKKRVTIYKVEHKQDGKKYDFISSQALQREAFVVCDTTQGKSYGRIVAAHSKLLTEQEIKQYKECWRA